MCTLIPVTDENWFFSPYTWCFRTGATAAVSATTTDNSAYFRVGFTGSSASVHFDTSALQASGVPPEHFHILKYSIDGGERKTVTIPMASLTAATDLDPCLPHRLDLFINYNELYMDRWNGPGVCVTVTGLELDAGAATLPVPVRHRRVLVFGDSTGEGRACFVPIMCDLLDTEYGVAAFRGLGWMCGVHPDVPPFVESWPYYFAGSSRLTNGTLQPPPDLICVVLGTNDHFQGVKDDVLTDGVVDWLRAARRAAPKARIAVTVPFGGFKRSAISSAVQKFVAKTWDRRVYLVDLGPEGERGLNQPGAAPNEISHDGVHPSWERHKALAKMMANVMERILTSSSSIDSSASLKLALYGSPFSS